MICDLFLCFDFEGLCVHHFIVMFWLKASVSMNMLYMVVTAPVSKTVDILVESLRIAEHAGHDHHGAGVGNKCEGGLVKNNFCVS